MLMRSIKSSGGIAGGRIRNQQSAHKMWTETLDHMSTINQQLAAIQSSHNKAQSKAAVHVDLLKSSIEKDYKAFKKALVWFKDNADFGESDSQMILISYSTGLISSKEEDEINPDEFESVSQKIQTGLDKHNFTDKISLKSKVKNLSFIKKTVTVNNRKVVDPQKLFLRLILVSEREQPSRRV